MEYVCTLTIPHTDMLGLLDCNYGWGHGILGLKGLNPSIFHHWYNHTNVDLVHHIYSFFHYHDHPYDGTNTNSKYQLGFRLPDSFRLRYQQEYLFHSSSTENSFSFIFWNYYMHIWWSYFQNCQRRADLIKGWIRLVI